MSSSPLLEPSSPHTFSPAEALKAKNLTLTRRRLAAAGERRLTADDKFDIMNLISAYQHAITGDDPDGFADLFNDGGNIEVMKSGTRVQGGRALKEFCSSAAKVNRACSQTDNNILITGTESKAQNVSNWQTFQHSRSQVSVVALSPYRPVALCVDCTARR
jgi:hypothetical protein